MSLLINPCMRFLLAVFLLASTLGSYAQEHRLKADFSQKEQYLKTIDFIAHSAKDIYCYFDLKKETYGVDWSLIIKNAKDTIADDTTLPEFQKILTKIAASLHDGHVNYIPNDLKKYYYTPIQIKKLPDGYYISNVEPEKIWPYPVNIEAGDKVIAINGQAIVDYVTEKSKSISASTPNALKSYTAASLNSLDKFVDAPADNLVLTLEKYNSHEKITIELPWIQYNQSIPEKSLSDIVQSKILPGNIGLLTLSSMAYGEDIAKHIEYIQKVMSTLRNTKALIIDVRNNGGGHGEIGDSVIAHFVTKKTRRYQAQLRNSYQVLFSRPELVEIFKNTDPATDLYSEWQDYDIQPLATDKPVYDKPVYILTNERCFSACDTFVDSFSSNHLGKVLGAQTGGGTGYPLWFELPWNMGHFRVSVLRGYSNHGRYLEGVGTLPDVALYNTQHDLYHHLDGELMKAYDYVVSDIHEAKLPMNPFNLAQYFTPAKTEIIPFDVEQDYWARVQQ